MRSAPLFQINDENSTGYDPSNACKQHRGHVLNSDPNDQIEADLAVQCALLHDVIEDAGKFEKP